MYLKIFRFSIVLLWGCIVVSQQAATRGADETMTFAGRSMKVTSGDRWWFSPFSHGFVIREGGHVGINIPSENELPQQYLDVNGPIRLRNVAADPGPGNASALFSQESGGNSYLYGRSGTRTKVQITSHMDPRYATADAQTAFADRSVVLPFSFHHSNDYVGKGAVVDMAKLVAWAEKKMQEELGEAEGRLVFVYDLPSSETASYEDWREEAVDRFVTKAKVQLAAMSWKRVGLGADAQVPAEAVEEVPELLVFEELTTDTEQVIDFASMRVVTKPAPKRVRREVPTGQMKKQLRKGWVFRDGGLYRAPSIESLDLDAVVDEVPKLPRWILSRIGKEDATLSRAELVREVRDRLRAEDATPAEWRP